MTAQFGDTRASGVNWDGMVIATERDAPVSAVVGRARGLRRLAAGLGLLAIVDHGEGYLSLYGHNDRLLKAVGERSAAGESSPRPGIPAAGAAPSCISRSAAAGKPVDPRPWFRQQPLP